MTSAKRRRDEYEEENIEDTKKKLLSLQGEELERFESYRRSAIPKNQVKKVSRIETFCPGHLEG